MATTAAPFGLRPIRSLVGDGSNSGITRPYKLTNSYGTSVFYGDIVNLDANGVVIKSSSTNDIANVLGVFLGCEYTDPNLGYKLHRNMWLASTVATDIVAYVCDDPYMLYEMQADDTIAQTGLGMNYAVVQTAGNTAIGMSKNALDASSVTTTNSFPIRVVGFKDGPTSAVGDTYTDCIVMINPAINRHLNSQGL